MKKNVICNVCNDDGNIDGGQKDALLRMANVKKKKKKKERDSGKVYFVSRNYNLNYQIIQIKEHSCGYFLG